MGIGKEITQELFEIEEKLFVLASVERRLKIIRHEIPAVEHQLVVQAKKMDQELKDVEELEKRGVKALFKQILGDIESQLEKERQEYLHEVLTYNSLVDELDTLKFEEAVLAKKFNDQQDLEMRYQVLLKEKERQIKLNYPKLNKELNIIDAQIRMYMQIAKECIEALHSGNDLMQYLSQVKSQLGYVKQWGSTKYRGKGRTSSYAKKGFIDKAQQIIGTVQVKFNIYEKELQDLFPDFELNLDSYHVKAFIHNFYDGLITDWIIVKHLKIAIQSTDAAIHKVTRLNGMVEQELTNAKERGALKRKEREDLIKQAPLQ